MRSWLAKRTRGEHSDVEMPAQRAGFRKTARSTHGVNGAVRGCRIEFGRRLTVAAAILLALPVVCQAASTAAISGVVRDTEGVAQMGAMVQVLSGANSVATAFTDLYGRYRIANLVAGNYEVRASAALFVPAMRGNLRLANGTRATVNLTLSMLSDPAAWIPAERRRPDEPSDDWGWTMRATESRPILRMEDNGNLVLVSSSVTDRPHGAPVEAREALTAGDGQFGGGGGHSTITLNRMLDDNSSMVLRSDLGTPVSSDVRGPVMQVDAGYEHRGILGGASRLVVAYESHPELMNSNGAFGMQAVRISSAEQMRLGDTVELEAGGTMVAVRTTANAIATQPFMRISVHPNEIWTVAYRFATSRDVQGFDNLDTVDAGVPLAARVAGRMQLEGGLHQEIAVSRKAGHGILRAAIYRDDISRPVIAGAGVMTSGDQRIHSAGNTVVADTVTDGFEFLGPGYDSEGITALLSEPLTSAIWAAVQVQQGSALITNDELARSLAEEFAAMHAVKTEAITAALNGRVVRAGTKLQASYRWQPRHLLTPVAAYEGSSDSPYLSFYVRQSMRVGGLLPPGLEATVEVTNLLAQGYQPFLSEDGRTLYLAQAPRSLQAGLSFTF